MYRYIHVIRLKNTGIRQQNPPNGPKHRIIIKALKKQFIPKS